jgi:hypothetical protein
MLPDLSGPTGSASSGVTRRVAHDLHAVLLAIAHVLHRPAADLLRPDTDPDIREGELEVSVCKDDWSQTVAEHRELVIGRLGAELEDELEQRARAAMRAFMRTERKRR